MNKGIQLSITVEGGRRFVSSEVTFKHLAKALVNTELATGTHILYIDEDGRVFVNNECVYIPKPLQQKEQAT